MVGPTVARIDFICTPNDASTSTIRFLFANCSSSSTNTLPPSSYFLSKSRVGYLYLVHGSLGFIGVFRSTLPATVLPPAFSSPSPTVISMPGSLAGAFSLGFLSLFNVSTSVFAGAFTRIPSSVKSTVCGAGSS